MWIFQQKSMVLCNACAKIVRITKGSGPPVSPHGVPCGPSVRFVQEMHGFVCSRDENSGFCNGKWAPVGSRVTIRPPGNLRFVWGFVAFSDK